MTTSWANRSFQLAVTAVVFGTMSGPALCEEPPEATRVVPNDGAQVLSALSEDHLRELYSQVGAQGKEAPPPEKMVSEIVNYLRTHPDADIVLKPRAKVSLKNLPPLVPGGTYFLGYPGDGFWKREIVKNGSNAALRLSLPPGSIVGLRLRLCGTYAFSQEFVFEDGPFVVPDGVRIVTPCWKVSFPAGLSMGANAGFFGIHPCGLTVSTTTLSGAQGACSVWPTISTSVQHSIDSECLEQFAPVDVPLFLLSSSCASALDINGTDGQPGPDRAARVGVDGPDATCNLACWPQTVLPGHGEDLPDGLAGGNGEEAKRGLSTAPLSVLASTIHGSFKFRTSAGNGGSGGWGGHGQTLFGGRGGDIPGMCKPCVGGAAPARGGNAGVAGRGGNGAPGANGGTAADIRISISDYTTIPNLQSTDPVENHVLAIAPGGYGGCGGARGAGGNSVGGPAGCWGKITEPGNDCPGDPPGTRGTGHGFAPAGTDGAPGTRGLNGQIFVNGTQVRGASESDRQSAFWADYSWPYILDRQACAEVADARRCPNQPTSSGYIPPPLRYTK